MLLQSNQASISNVAIGLSALSGNVTGDSNTAIGTGALSQNLGSDNIAIGEGAGTNNQTGNHNIWIGDDGLASTSDNDTIRIGTVTGAVGAPVHTQTFIAGISGVNVAGGAAVFVKADGQLGTVVSSARYKEDIRDLGEVSNRLLNLRPVSFRYKADVQEGERPVQYGLIAEEVEKVFPELVIYNDEGKPETVAYHILSTLLLNELQGVQSRVIELQSTRNENEDRLVELEKELKENRARMVAWENERREKEARLIALEGMVERLAAPRHHRASFAPAH